MVLAHSPGLPSRFQSPGLADAVETHASRTPSAMACLMPPFLPRYRWACLAARREYTPLPMAPQYIFTMKDLRKIHPPNKEVLKGIWLSFYPGAKIGVIGPNGAGKSTMLRIMAGVDTEFLGEAWPAEGTKVGYLA